MKKVFQTMYGLIRKSQKNISDSLGEKESEKAADEFIQKSNEIKAEIQEKIIQTSEELSVQIKKASENAKENLNKSKKKASTTKKTPAKKATSKTKEVKKTTKAPTKKTSTAKKSTTKVTEKAPAKKTTTAKPVKKSSAVKKTAKTPTKKTTKAPAKKAASTTTASKTVTQKKTTTTKSKKVSVSVSSTSYPTGKIVNSKVLSSVERGYLELAGYSSYKDAFVNLDTPAKRTKVAKEVTTTATVLNNSLNKLQLLSVKGLGENVAVMLCEVGVNSVAKLQKADPSKTHTKILKLKDSNKDFKANVSLKQLEGFVEESKKL